MTANPPDIAYAKEFYYERRMSAIAATGRPLS